jgi:PAS domain S-box-containing protein
MKILKDKDPGYQVSFNLANCKKIEEQLKIKDFAIQSAISAIAFADMNGKVIFTNNSFIKLWGYLEQKEIIGKNITEFAASAEQIKEIVSTLNEGKGYIGEGYALKKDGTSFLCQAYVNLVTGNEGKPICMIASFLDITEYKKVEVKAQKNEIQFRSLFANMLEGYAYCRMLFENGRPVDFIYLEVNKKFEELTGLKNVIGRRVSEVIPGLSESNSELIKTYGRVALTGIPEKFETFLPDLEMWLLISVYCPQKEYFIAVFDVITERKNTEEKLINTQLLLREVIESPKDMIILAVDKDFNYLFFNRVYKNIMKQIYGKEVKAGMNMLDCITVEIDKKYTRKNFELALDGQSHSSVQEFGDKKRNSYETFYNPIINGKDIIIGATAFSRDITDRINAETAINESERKYRELFNNMTVGFGLHELIFDEKGRADDYRFLDVNPAFEKITGLKASEVVGKTVKKILPGTEQYWLDTYSRLSQGGEHIIFQNYSKDLKKWFDVRAFNAGDNRFATIFSDITEQKQSFLRLQKILEDTTKAFSSIVEVKDPYTSGHQERVAKLSLAIGRELMLDEKIMNALSTAALLHDLGKIAIPSSILSKPSKLTDIEFEMIKTHSNIGYNVLKDIDFGYPVATIILQHHERNNGSGYPDGIKSPDIMFESKIIAIADTVEAMSSHRPYRPAIGIIEALKEIEKNKDMLYDKTAVDACIKLFNSKNFQF